MKALLLSVVLALFVFTINTNAQDSEQKNGFSGKIMVMDHHTPSPEGLPSLDYLANGFEAAYHRHIHRFVTVGLPVKLGVAKIPESLFKNRIQVGSADVIAKVRYFDKDNLVVPYIFGGIGAVFEADQDMYTQTPLGVGVDFKIGPWGYISLHGEYRNTLTADIERDNLQYGVGFLFIPGKAPKSDEIPDVLDIMSDVDTDQDGIIDKKDDCPLLAGVAAFNGCPDTDGDGIGDKEDMCPDDEGPIELSGCPDSDGDGFSDIEDNCPDLAGVLMGCPDSDGDGIADNEDECPEDAGEINGCPDSDGDGIADKDDKCPQTPGTLELMGCSDRTDTDGDGVADVDDNCPNISGSLSNNGCPSVNNTSSSSSTYPSSTYNSGNSDLDGDSVPDNIDACPNVYGSINNAGCPAVSSSVTTVLKDATQNVRFETASKNLMFESYEVLDQVVSLMNTYPDHHLKISGHTDNVGDSGNNKNLSERRAKACLEYLKNKGISDLRMSFIGYGEDRPVDDNDTSEGRYNNRRVEFALFLPRDSR